MSVLENFLRVTMPDGSRYDVPVMIIAENRAKFYADISEIPVEEALGETENLFKEDNYEIEEWASSNMNWDEVEDHATLVIEELEKPKIDFQDGWVNGNKEIVEHKECL